MIERIFPAGAPVPKGPYSPAVRAGDFVFVSGHVPADPSTGELRLGTIEHETRLTLNNVKRALEAAGAACADVVKVNVYLRDGNDWGAMNAVYAEFFGQDKPARTTVGVQFAHPEMKIEIDCVAWRPLR